MPPPLPPTPGSLRNTYPRSDVDDLDVNNDLAEPIELAPKYPSQHPASAEMSEPAPVAPAPADAAATSPALPPLPGAAKGDATSTNSGTGQSLMPPALPSQRPGALFGARPGPPPFHRNGGDGST